MVPCGKTTSASPSRHCGSAAAGASCGLRPHLSFAPARRPAFCVRERYRRRPLCVFWAHDSMGGQVGAPAAGGDVIVPELRVHVQKTSQRWASPRPSRRQRRFTSSTLCSMAPTPTLPTAEPSPRSSTVPPPTCGVNPCASTIAAPVNRAAGFPRGRLLPRRAPGRWPRARTPTS